VLLIDNGGDTIKYGWLTEDNENNKPQGTLPNVTARLPQQWTVLVGDQLASIQNPNTLIGVTRSTERGIISNFGNQVQVWKRLLDILGVAVPLDSITAQAFGWKKQAARDKTTNEKPKTIPASHCAVFITVPPYCPRTVLDQITLIWLEDFDFAHVGLCTTGVAASYATVTPSPVVPTARCMVDVGWSATTVIPTYRHRVPLSVPSSNSDQDSTHNSSSSCIRRMPLGGRHLINMLSYYCSYRQWNLMGQEGILRPVLEQTCFVSMDLNADYKTAQRVPAGRRPYDREFVLPDYHTTFVGHVQLPLALQRLQNQEEEEEEGEDDEDDESVREEDMNEEDVELDVGEDVVDEALPPKKKERPKSNSKKNHGKKDAATTSNKGSDDHEDEQDSDSDDDMSDDDDDVEVLRQQLLKQRQEEERRRRAMEAEQQILRLSVERFSIPEVLFRPSDGGLPRDWAGLAETVQQAIAASPPHLHAALYQSIRLVGGLSQLPNLKERFEQELRSIMPCDYDLSVSLSEVPQDEIWQGLKAIAQKTSYKEWSISREEWLSKGKRGAWGRLTHNEGGYII
jgi:actin-related protein